MVLIGKVYDYFGSFSQMNESVIITLPTISSIQYASNLVTKNASKFLGVGDTIRALQLSMGAAKLVQLLSTSGSILTRSLSAPQQVSVTSDILKNLNVTVYTTRMKQASF